MSCRSPAFLLSRPAQRPPLPHLNKARSTVLGMATDTFAQNYTTAFTNGLSAAITQLQAKSTATVRKVYVSDVNGNNAEAVVTIDSEVHSTAGTRQVVGSYLDLTLLRQGGRWKVNQVTSIAASSNNLTPNGATPGATSPGSTTPSAPATTVAPSPKG
jgi:Mce-associated membrane protein